MRSRVLVTLYSHFAINDVVESTSVACLIVDADHALSSSCRRAIFATALCLRYEFATTLLVLSFHPISLFLITKRKTLEF